MRRKIYKNGNALQTGKVRVAVVDCHVPGAITIEVFAKTGGPFAKGRQVRGEWNVGVIQLTHDTARMLMAALVGYYEPNELELLIKQAKDEQHEV